MRREDRRIDSAEQILEIAGRCSVMSLAFENREYPYVVPVNFGVCREGDKVIFYFHGASQGTKADLIRKNKRAAFCMETGEELKLLEPACRSTMLYESVCGTGDVEFVEDKAEKLLALTAIMKQYDKSGRNEFDMPEAAVEKTGVFKLCVREMTGKSNKVRTQ